MPRNTTAWTVSLLLAGAVTALADAPFRDLDFDSARKQAGQQGKLVFVDFFTTWCAPCKVMDRTTFKDKQVTAWLERHTIPIKIDAERQERLADRYKVMLYPTCVVVRPDGTEVSRILGFVEPRDMISQLGRVPLPESKPAHPISDKRKGNGLDVRPVITTAPALDPNQDPRWRIQQPQVVHAHAVSRLGWDRSVAYFYTGYLQTGGWTYVVDGDLAEQMKGQPGWSLYVGGDCTADVSVGAGSLIHIRGDLKGRLMVDDRCEVVIAGQVDPGGGVFGDDLVSVFVGGDMAGTIHHQGRATVWVQGDATGEIGIGSPSGDVHVVGDWSGSLRPLRANGLVDLVVEGFADSANVQRDARKGFTQFIASIGRSDVDPGLYPTREMAIKMSRWVVRARQPSP